MHTFVIMEVSISTFQEIKDKLLAADYGHAVVKEGAEQCLDMHGIALRIGGDLGAIAWEVRWESALQALREASSFTAAGRMADCFALLRERGDRLEGMVEVFGGKA